MNFRRGLCPISTLIALSASTCPLNQSPCDALKAAGLQEPILQPGDVAYTERISTLWSASARLEPACIVTPKDANEVSKVLITLHKTPQTKFAIRGRGHSHWAGSNNVDGGVQIDLSIHFVGATYDPKTKLASVLPATRWGVVLQTLESQHGVSVVAGREGNVGVGGFITGGGNSWHTGKHGFACDNIANAEVVLANGSIVNANKNENADLLKALKGGWGNFGIVTRFDLFTFPSVPVWGGLRISELSESPLVAQSVVDFTTNISKNPGSSYLVSWSYDLNISPDPIIAQFVVDTDGIVNSPAFTQALSSTEIMNDFSVRTMGKLVDDYRTSGGKRNVWFTFTFVNDIRIINKAAELNAAFVADMLKVVPASELTTQSTFQPMPRVFFDIGEARGGNVLGMDRIQDDSLQWLLTCTVATAEQQKFLHARSSQFTSDLETFAISIEILREWKYINYADPTQDPIRSYGAENVAFLKQVSDKYDPTGLFQKQASGVNLPA